MSSTRETLTAMDQIEELLRSVSLTPEQRDHYERELAEVKARLQPFDGIVF